MLLNRASWVKSTTFTLWCLFRRWNKFSSTSSKPRLSTIIIEKLVRSCGIILILPLLVVILIVVVVTCSISALLIVLNLLLFVTVLILVLLCILSFFLSIFLELKSCAYKSLSSLWLLVTLTWGTLSWIWQVLSHDLLFNLIDVYIAAISWIDKSLKSGSILWI